jgi:hypothetical protein
MKRKTITQKKSANDFFSNLSAPAKRALEREGITTINQLSQYSEKKLLQLHGLGPSTIPKLRTALEAQGLTFKK